MTKKTTITLTELKRLAGIAKGEQAVISVAVGDKTYSVSPYAPSHSHLEDDPVTELRL